MIVRAQKNPILPNTGVCDPHIHIFNDRAYLYATHDGDRDDPDFVMYDWQIWSSPDLVEWTLERTVRPEETYIGPSRSCWATDAAERNGKYYFYFSNCIHDTGVMVGEAPAGPFVDALGTPLLPRGLTPTRSYDPAVFIDDDAARTPYIIFGVPDWAGGDGYYLARLNEDMISLAEPPRKVLVNHVGDDKPSIHKYQGTYYLSWASFYAVADSVYGPYTYVGNTGTAHDHGSFFTWNNQGFHAFVMFDPTMTFRSTGITYVHYRADGRMVEDQLIAEFGVGQYDARWNQLQAQWYMASHHMVKRENARADFEVCAHGDGAYVSYPNVHHLPANARLCLFGACANPTGCTIEVREDAPDGTLLGAYQAGYNGGYDAADWRGYTTMFVDLQNEAGTQNLYLVFCGEGEELYRLDWFRFLDRDIAKDDLP